MKATAKRISLVIAAIFIISSHALAVPQLINYQGALSNSSGPVNGDVGIAFTIYNTPTAGDVLWSETQTVSVTDGAFNVLLGSQTPFPADLFAGDERYLGVQVGADPEMAPRQRLASVPFALGAPVCYPGDSINCYTGPDGTLGVGECKTGARACNPSGTGFFGTCENEVTPLQDTCDGLDNDCDPATLDGSEDPSLGSSCDGSDSDLCVEGTIECSGGALDCSDSTSSSFDVCNGADDDCDPASADGSEDPLIGTPCDGPDSDLCPEGITDCSGGALACSEALEDDLDLCDGLNNDCNAATADGSDEPTLGNPCDGADTDLCLEGNVYCSGVGGLACDDTSGNNPDLCNGDTNDDCNAATADGSDEPTLGDLCDGADSDLCTEGNVYCSGAGGLACSDSTGNTLDICDGADNDCNPATTDGSQDPSLGNSCDGPDSDLCLEGTISCSGGALACSDSTGNNPDLCNGFDDDCNAATADGTEEPTFGDPCDGADSDLCFEGNVYCSGVGGLACSDSTGNTLDLCNGFDDDCNAATADGSDEPTLGNPCDGADSDLCTEGTIYCSGAGGLECSDSTGDTLEICGDSIDNDCDGETDEGCLSQPSSAGDLVITEIMGNPDALPDTQGEWFELYNPTGGDLTLLNCVLSDYGTDSHIITSEVLVPALGYATLAISDIPGFIPDYVYTGFNLGNSGDEIILTCGGVVIDEVQYGSAFITFGKSKALYSDSLDAVSNDTLSNWYDSITPYFTGDLGTPGTVNEY